MCRLMYPKSNAVCDLYVQGFIQDFFVGEGGRGGGVDMCDVHRVHVCVSAPTRVLQILMKFWTYLRTRVIGFNYNCCTLL